jgi:hypothetical protein
LSEDGVNWSAPEPWAPTRAFTLSPGSGFKVIFAQITDGVVTQVVSDMIYLADPDSPGRPITARAFAPIVLR